MEAKDLEQIRKQAEEAKEPKPEEDIYVSLINATDTQPRRGHSLENIMENKAQIRHRSCSWDSQRRDIPEPLENVGYGGTRKKYNKYNPSQERINKSSPHVSPHSSNEAIRPRASHRRPKPTFSTFNKKPIKPVAPRPQPKYAKPWRSPYRNTRPE